MSELVSRDIETCRCGRQVAMLLSSNGRPYPVEIRNAVQVGHDGTFARVVTNDFHECVSLPGLAEFIRAAIERSAAKRIRIRLLSTDNESVVLSWQHGKRVVYVSDGGPYGQSRYYGSIDLESGGFRLGDDYVGDLLDLLAAISERPAEAAQAYGRATNQCCFCDRPLDDERSTIAGYGGTCAAKFGLPWGDEGEGSRRRAKRTRRAVGLDEPE